MIAKVRKLAFGEGLACKNWRPGIKLLSGVMVDQSFDAEAMLQQAEQRETRYGKDLDRYELLHWLRKLHPYKMHKFAHRGRTAQVVSLATGAATIQPPGFQEPLPLREFPSVQSQSLMGLVQR